MQSKEPGFFVHLESMGVEEVEKQMFSGAFGSVTDASNWRIVAAKEFVSAKRASRAEQKVAEALEISRAANAIAQRNARYAMYAAVIAAMAALFASKDELLTFLGNF